MTIDTSRLGDEPGGSRLIVGDAILRNARYFRDKTAFIGEDRTLTHGEFADRVTRLINALCRMSLPRQARLAVLSHNSCAMLEIGGAAELGGFVALPLNHRLSADELVAICKDAAPSVLFYQREFEPAAQRIRAELGVPTACLDGTGFDGGMPAYDALVRSETSGTLARTARDDEAVHMIYTSGTTGGPKGVLLGHRGQVEAARILAASAGVRSLTRLMLVMPLFHTGGKGWQMAATWQGGTVIVRPRFIVSEWTEMVARHRATVAHLAPVMIRGLLDEPATGHDLSSLETVGYASSPIPQRDLVRAIERFGPVFVQYYGTTETGPITILDKEFHEVTGQPERDARLTSAGCPNIGSRIEVRRPDGQPCADGETGEVCVDTPTLMLGYWNSEQGRPDLVPRGWFATGDLGYVGPDALLYLVDRKKDMIVSGGENIYSREVEEALHRHVAIREAAVFGVPDERWGEAVAAYVVFKDGQSATETELIAHCRNHLASYKKPRHVWVTDALPRLAATGKIDKKALRAKHWGQEGRFIA